MTDIEHECFTQIESDDFMSDPLGLDSNTKTESSNLNNENLKFTSSYKIIILGEQSVGKTSILSRFIDNKFEKQCTLSLENKNKNLKITLLNYKYGTLQERKDFIL